MGKRQKTQLELAWEGGARGEALEAPAQGIESTAAGLGKESPADTDKLMEEACEKENLRQALRRVKANAGAAGVDGMSVQQLPEYLRESWPRLREQLFAGSYRPQPVRRVEMPKAGGGVRKLGIPTVVDRFVQQAVMQVLQKRWDLSFSDSSYGFRPGRSVHQAVEKAQEYIRQGYDWVVELDLEKFFDRVNHDVLMGRVAKRVSDKRMLKLMRGFLNSGCWRTGWWARRRRARRRVRSERAGWRVMESVKRFLTGKLRLKVNEAKSAVARPKDRKFLGFSFTGGESVKRRIAPQAVLRFKGRIRELTRRTRGISIERMIGELRPYMIGWRGYFGFCETPSILRELESWTRRRLRCFLWKQWKRGKARFKQLRKRGIGEELAACTAGSAHGPWRLSSSPA